MKHYKDEMGTGAEAFNSLGKLQTSKIMVLWTYREAKVLKIGHGDYGWYR